MEKRPVSFELAKIYGPGNYEGKSQFLEDRLRLSDYKLFQLQQAVARAYRSEKLARQELLRLQDIAVEQSEQLSVAHKKARTDVKTGLLSPRGLKEGYEAIKNECSVMSAVYIDIDNFKEINSRLGHPLVDKEVLRPLGTAIKERTRSNFDIVGRHGGDEILLLLPHTPVEQARTVAESFVEVLDGVPFAPEIGRLTFSVGITEINTSLPYNDAISPAALAMQQAKEAGKNQTVVNLIQNY